MNGGYNMIFSYNSNSATSDIDTNSSATFTTCYSYIDDDVELNEKIKLDWLNKLIKESLFWIKSRIAVYGWCWCKWLKEYVYVLLYWINYKKCLCKLKSANILLNRYYSGFVLDGRGRHFNYEQNNSRWY